MTNPHPITPPSEIISKWQGDWYLGKIKDVSVLDHIANQAARWGWDQRGAATEAELQQRADQELEECCQYIGNEGEWFASPGPRLAELRAARRPKPPSLKEQALNALEQLLRDPEAGELTSAPDTIRRALEALPK